MCQSSAPADPVLPVLACDPLPAVDFLHAAERVGESGKDHIRVGFGLSLDHCRGGVALRFFRALLGRSCGCVLRGLGGGGGRSCRRCRRGRGLLILRGLGGCCCGRTLLILRGVALRGFCADAFLRICGFCTFFRGYSFIFNNGSFVRCAGGSCILTGTCRSQTEDKYCCEHCCDLFSEHLLHLVCL